MALSPTQHPASIVHQPNLDASVPVHPASLKPASTLSSFPRLRTLCAVVVQNDNDDELRIISCTTKALELLGANKEAEIIGKSFYNFCHPDSQAPVRKTSAKLLGTSNVSRSQATIIRIPASAQVHSHLYKRRSSARLGEAGSANEDCDEFVDEEGYIEVQAQFKRTEDGNILIQLKEVYAKDEETSAKESVINDNLFWPALMLCTVALASVGAILLRHSSR